MRMRQAMIQEPIQHQTTVHLYAPEVSVDAKHLRVCVEESGVRVTLRFNDLGTFERFLDRLSREHRAAA
jgi:hypothetical protein